MTPFVSRPDNGQPRVSVRAEPEMSRKVMPLTLPTVAPPRLPSTIKMAFWHPAKLMRWNATALIALPSTDSTAIAECEVLSTVQSWKVMFVNGPVLAVPNLRPLDCDLVMVQFFTSRSLMPRELPLLRQIESSPESMVQLAMVTCQQSTTSQPSRLPFKPSSLMETLLIVRKSDCMLTKVHMAASTILMSWMFT